jgi:hypothetical protein
MILYILMGGETDVDEAYIACLSLPLVRMSLASPSRLRLLIKG